MKRALMIHLSVVVMNTVPFSTDVAAAAFQYNHYIQYKLRDASCFVKTGHMTTCQKFLNPPVMRLNRHCIQHRFFSKTFLW